MHTDTDLFKIETNHVTPTRGSLLIAEPFLQDASFARTVILLIEHAEGGSMGLVLNRPSPMNTHDVTNALMGAKEFPIYLGGPVGSDLLFCLHTFSEMPGAVQITDELWLNGDLECMPDYLNQEGVYDWDARFFVGYSGWEAGQLEQEIANDSWLVGQSDWFDVMRTSRTQGLWKRSMNRLGGKYALWARFPQNPMLN